MLANADNLNWLLSATMQSAAALVAIVGGFLVHRLTSLHAQQEQLGREVIERGEKHRRMQEARDRRLGPVHGVPRILTADEVKQERQRLRDEEDRRENEQALINAKILQAVSERIPSEVRGAFIVLALLALVGVLFPAFLLAYGTHRVPTWWAWVVLAAFTAGVTLLFVHLLALTGDVPWAGPKVRSFLEEFRLQWGKFLDRIGW